MKIAAFFVALPLFLLSSLPSFAIDPDSERIEPELERTREAQLRTGMSRGALVGQLGAPAERLSENVWVYTDFHALDRPAREKTDTLVVVFKENRVVHLRLTRYALIAPAIAQARAGARVAAAK